MSDAATPEAPAAPPPAGGGIKRMIALGGMLAVASVGGGYVSTLRTSGQQEKAHQAPRLGPTVPLETFIVNLDEPGGMRYLKASIELEVKKPPADEGPGLALRTRDQMLVYLSTLKVAQVQRTETKEAIRSRLLEIARTVYGKDQIRAVLFKELVIQ